MQVPVQSFSYRGPKRLLVAEVWFFAIVPCGLYDLCVIGAWLGRIRPANFPPGMADSFAMWCFLLIIPTGILFCLSVICVLTLLAEVSVPWRVRLEGLIVFSIAWSFFVVLIRFANPIYTGKS